MRFLGLLICLIALVSVPLVACAPKAEVSPTPSPTPQKITWKLNSQGMKGAYAELWTEWFCERVTERSNGRMELVPYFGGELGYKGPELLRVVRDGLLDITHIILPQVSGDFPEPSLAELPFLCAEVGECALVVEKIHPMIEKQLLEKWNLVMLKQSPNSWQAFGLKEEIKKIEDFGGLKIRVASEPQAELVKALGAVPVTIQAAELYTAVQRGTVDGWLTAPQFAYSIKLYEVTPYIMWLPITSMTDVIVVNKNSFEGLPKDLQNVLIEAGEATVSHAIYELNTLFPTWRMQLEGAGATVYVPPPDVTKAMQSKAPPIWASWTERASPLGKEMIAIAREALGK